MQDQSTSRFVVSLGLDNEAMQDVAEVARLLRQCAERIECFGLSGGVLRDINGNTVGEFGVRS